MRVKKRIVGRVGGVGALGGGTDEAVLEGDGDGGGGEPVIVGAEAQVKVIGRIRHRLPTCRGEGGHGDKRHAGGRLAGCQGLIFGDGFEAVVAVEVIEDDNPLAGLEGGGVVDFIE